MDDNEIKEYLKKNQKPKIRKGEKTATQDKSPHVRIRVSGSEDSWDAKLIRPDVLPNEITELFKNQRVVVLDMKDKYYLVPVSKINAIGMYKYELKKLEKLTEDE